MPKKDTIPTSLEMGHSLRITASLPIDARKLFQYCSHRERLKEWFFPGGWSSATDYELTQEEERLPEIICEGSRDPTDDLGALKGDDSYVFTLEVKEVLPEAKITFNFSSSLVKDSLIELLLTSDEIGTILTISQSNLPNFESSKIFQAAWTINLGILERKILSERIN